MAQRRSEEFRRDAVRIAPASGLSRQQVAADLGVGFVEPDEVDRPLRRPGGLA